jgi:CubicO group peptidase (beta-lactamase class C family)
MRAAESIDRVLTRAVESSAAAGIVALASDGSGVCYAGALGRREIGGATAMTLDTLFSIASMTKAITSVAALRLVEQGRITLDEPLAARLPALGAVPVLDGFDADGAPRLSAQRGTITLRHLLTHTAGFAYPGWNPNVTRYRIARGGSIPQFTMPLVREPGDRWEYGTNIDWVGRLVEELSGDTLEDHFRRHIFAPLGMHDTSYHLDDHRRARLATRHQRQPDGSLRTIPGALPDRPAYYNGGGGLFSTGPDYLRFLRALLGGGTLDGVRLLRPETVREIARNQIGDLAVQPLPSDDPTFSNRVEPFPGTVTKWGLAGMINTEPTGGGRSAGSWAWGGLYNTYFWLDPTRRVTGLILTQVLPFWDGPVLDALAEFERAVYRG